MKKRNIILISLVVIFAIYGCLYFYSKYFSGSDVDLNNQESVQRFLKKGNLTSATADETKNEWLFVYEEPGKPALSNRLMFNNKTVCYLTNGIESQCDKIKFRSGDRVEIAGEIKDGKVTVSELAMIKETEYGEEYNPERICIQVITSAKNPSTGEKKEFPTQCDVPVGWEIINESSF